MPAELNSFVGRRQELSDVRSRLLTSRLVTLTGVGGVGKSRLAMRVARELRRSFPDGVWLVELVGLPDPVLLPQVVCDALGIADQSCRGEVEVLSHLLADRQLLLLVDNCEHLVPACATLIAELLRASPGLRVLATSREILAVPGEQVYTVLPLAVPDAGEVVDPGDLGRYPALSLFVERGASVRHAFAVSADNVGSIARICQRLDGIPLAIELAAARLRSLPVEQVASRLDDRFALLTTRSAAALPRHRTLRAAMDWSFTLCSAPEQLLWVRASVFVGRFSLEAAEQVCAGGALSSRDILEALTGLVDKSVVSAEDPSAGLPYRMLATVRDYGLDRLREPCAEGAAAGNGAVLTRRHLDFYVGLAERFDADWFSPRQVQWSQRLHAELPNLQAALGFCLTSPDRVADGLRLAGALQYFWWGNGEAREGRLWLERMLAADMTPCAARLRALTAEGRLLTAQGLHGPAVQLMRPRLELARQYGEAALLADSLMVLGLCLVAAGGPAEALPLLDEAVQVSSQTGRPQTMASAKLYRAIGAILSGRPVMAGALLAECREICISNGDRLILGYALVSSGLEAFMRDGLAEAGAFARESLPIHQALRDRLGFCVALECLAWTAAAARDFRRAACLLGIHRRQSNALGGSPLQIEQYLSARRDCEASSTGALGDARFAAEYRRGEQFTLADAVTYALAEDHAAPENLAADTRPGSVADAPALTRRQRQVADLVAQGLSNREIARRLVIAVRTADSHVQNILLRLGFNSRAQIAAWCVQRQGSTE
jgi:predicted ATPase/DNA-binding NarL/FixJ family response regulator